MMNGKSVLITGGTGTLGKHLITYLLNRYPQINKIVVYSRDEKKQNEMTELFPHVDGAPIRYFIGDIRDKERLSWALENIDVVFHLAALSDVESIEYNPFEVLKTNVLGAQNLIESSLMTNVSDVITVSGSNVHSPMNLYEASKIFSEKMFVSANNIIGDRKLKFSVARLPSLFSSENSELRKISKQKSKSRVVLSDENSTRFYMCPEESVKFVVKSIEQHWGGEVFVPKCKSYDLLKFSKCFNSNVEIAKKTGLHIRVHEELFSEQEAKIAVELDKYFVIPPQNSFWEFQKWMEHFKGKSYTKDGAYCSSFGTKLEQGEIEKVISHFESHK